MGGQGGTSTPTFPPLIPVYRMFANSSRGYSAANVRRLFEGDYDSRTTTIPIDLSSAAALAKTQESS